MGLYSGTYLSEGFLRLRFGGLVFGRVYQSRAGEGIFIEILRYQSSFIFISSVALTDHVTRESRLISKPHCLLTHLNQLSHGCNPTRSFYHQHLTSPNNINTFSSC